MTTHHAHTTRSRAAVVAAVAVVLLVTATGCGITDQPSTGVEVTASIGPLNPTGTAAASSAVTELPTAQRPTPTAPPTTDPVVAGVDRSSPDAVATAVLTALGTADTTVDAGPNDAAARAVGLLTADYAAAVLTTPPLRTPGAQWVAQGVRLTATVEALPDDRPADTPTTATRIYLVTQTPTTAAGVVLAPVVTVAYVGLVRVQAGWAVAQVQQR